MPRKRSSAKGGLDQTVEVRVSAEEREAWRSQAEREGYPSLSAMIRAQMRTRGQVMPRSADERAVLGERLALVELRMAQHAGALRRFCDLCDSRKGAGAEKAARRAWNALKEVAQLKSELTQVLASFRAR